jgi:glycerate-2-kinase
MDGAHAENPKSQQDMGNSHQIAVLGSSSLLASKVAQQAEAQGYGSVVYNPAYDTSARIVARDIASRVKEKILQPSTKLALVFHGESNIHVTGGGKGGRNQELALLVLMALEEISVPWTLMSIGTDGIDGNTDAAGAFVYNGLLPLARHHGYSPEGYLLDNDAYNFFLGVDTLIRTGPTGNNMTDLQILIIDP